MIGWRDLSLHMCELALLPLFTTAELGLESVWLLVAGEQMRSPLTRLFGMAQDNHLYGVALLDQRKVAEVAFIRPPDLYGLAAV